MPPPLLAALARPLAILLPVWCAACGAPGAPLCRWCRHLVAWAPGPRCSRCWHPLGADVAGCAHCPPGVVTARHAAVYGGPVPAVVAALKDGRRRALAGVMAGLVHDRVPAPPGGAALVPVPLAPARRAERGFNQADLLARRLSRLWGVPVDAVLERVRDGAAQRGAARTARVRQVAGAFRVAPGTPPPPCAWLVDDVHTTGATLAACARALRRAGCRDVHAVTFARAVRT